MVLAGNKAKSFSLVNHTTKTIHLHYHHLVYCSNMTLHEIIFSLHFVYERPFVH